MQKTLLPTKPHPLRVAFVFVFEVTSPVLFVVLVLVVCFVFSFVVLQLYCIF